MKITGQLTVTGDTLGAMLDDAANAISSLVVAPRYGTWTTTIVLEGLRRQSAASGWIATAVFTAEEVAPVVVPELEPETPVDPELAP